MEKLPSGTILKAIGIGVVAGMRTFTAPLITHRYLRTSKSSDALSHECDSITCSLASAALTLMAAGELAADKSSSIPDRISQPSLTARAISGSICGGLIAKNENENILAGTIAGGLAAIGSAYFMFYARRSVSRHFPPFAVAVAEDSLALLGGSILSRIPR